MAIKQIIVSLALLQVILAAAGTGNVPCTGTAGTACTSACPASFPLPTGCTYSGNFGACIVSECTCSTTKLTDAYCASCKGATYFANTAQTACVQSSYSCLNRGTNAWTVNDCNTCTGSTNQKIVKGSCSTSANVLIASFFGLLLLLL
ncbi:cell surface immobilization antigen (macronuclear) [Tetrahymena thermophila SB210]|uniref:Cell surface immobilization antigen n=1 Tax=Tetrahymena thermophila (strain SB210) TaxID=312017 RepID=Q23QW8_TETTS|nr:cell surface immobilization antigen [Tetrahymena thermophila SB210]EAR98770.1 cell surface immobilization antigen [Tetrahymena thermophila SB210]|eukprot:XP_001019015.1 cell surface immobilization antigen [Tetrahymena thermophila SB210]